MPDHKLMRGPGQTPTKAAAADLVAGVVRTVPMMLPLQQIVTQAEDGYNACVDSAAQALGMDQHLFTLLVCPLGGLVVGVLVKLFGDHSGIFAEVMLELGKIGGFDCRNAPRIVVTAFVSLVAGASLGPKAPLASASGALAHGSPIVSRSKIKKCTQWATRVSTILTALRSARRTAGRTQPVTGEGNSR